MKGELVNNEHTKVTVTENKTTEQITTTIDIEKVLSEEILPNGDVMTKNLREITILTAEAIEETKAPTSSSVGVKIRLDFDKQSLGGFNTRKLTKFTITPLRLDSSFSMTSLEYQARNFGTGWTSNGTMYVASESTALQTITTIVYNSPLAHTTNFVKYTPIGSDVIAGSGVVGKFSYRRGAGDILTYNFDYGW